MIRFRVDADGSLPAGRIELRLLVPPARASDQKLLDLEPQLRHRFNASGVAELPRDRIMQDGAILFILVLQGGPDGADRMLARMGFRTASEIPDEVIFRVEPPARDPVPGPEPEPDAPDRTITPARRHASLDQVLAAQHAMSARIARPVRVLSARRLQEQKSRADTARRQADRLLGQPLGQGRNRRRFVAPDEAGAEKVALARSDGMQALSGTLPLRTGILLRDLEPPERRTDVPLSALMAKLGIDTTDLQRPVRGPLQACAARHRAAKAAANATPGDEQDGRDDGDQESDASSFEGVLRRILSGPTGSALARRPGRADVEANLAETLATGPADAPSIHDVSVLHVAWEDVWTAAIDSVIHSKVAELYAELVQLVDYVPPRSAKMARSGS